MHKFLFEYIIIIVVFVVLVEQFEDYTVQLYGSKNHAIINRQRRLGRNRFQDKTTTRMRRRRRKKAQLRIDFASGTQQTKTRRPEVSYVLFACIEIVCQGK